MKHYKNIFFIGLVLAFCCQFFSYFANAQNPEKQGFYPSEHLKYEVRFKWGLINGRAGLASIYTKRLPQNGQWYRELLFKTTGIFNTIFSMKDTMSTLYGANLKPLRWEKRVLEDNYYLVDEIQYTYTQNNVVVRSRRYTPSELKIDTIMNTSSKNLLLDMVAAFGYLRNESFELGPNGKSQRSAEILIPIGKDMVPCKLFLIGKDVIPTPWSNASPALKFILSIDDENFKGDDSVEIWVSDDPYRIPLNVRAKLKIGYAICRLMSHPYYNR